MKLEFTVKGEPVGKGRPRFSHGRKPYTPEKTAAYEDLIRQEFYRKFGRTSAENGLPVTLDIVAEFGIPKRTSRAARAKMLAWEIRPTKRPDADNIAKIVADALNGIAWHDDAQVVSMAVRKVYSETPGVRVCLSW